MWIVRSIDSGDRSVDIARVEADEAAPARSRHTVGDSRYAECGGSIQFVGNRARLVPSSRSACADWVEGVGGA
jgi:hypothetical protein